MTSKMKTSSKNEDNIKNEGNLKNEDDLKDEEDLKKLASPPDYFDPLPLKELHEIFLVTSHLDSHTTTDDKPDILSGVKTGYGIPHDTLYRR